MNLPVPRVQSATSSSFVHRRAPTELQISKASSNVFSELQTPAFGRLAGLLSPQTLQPDFFIHPSPR